MSKTEFVLVPRELLDRVLDPITTDDYINAKHEICALMAKPAKQHHGKPVALPAMKNANSGHDTEESYGDGWDDCLREIAKLGPLYTRPVQGEPVAVFSIDGTGYRVLVLDSALTNLPKDGALLYAHADLGEVERLNSLLRASRTSLDNCALQIENLQVQLAERDALLPTLDQGQKDALYSFYLSICCGDQHSVDKPLIRQLCEFGALESVGFGKHRLTKFGEYLLSRMSDAALSPSAEPVTYTFTGCIPSPSMTALAEQQAEPSVRRSADSNTSAS